VTIDQLIGDLRRVLRNPNPDVRLSPVARVDITRLIQDLTRIVEEAEQQRARAECAEAELRDLRAQMET
jgi:hypothetical protein